MRSSRRKARLVRPPCTVLIATMTLVALDHADAQGPQRATASPAAAALGRIVIERDTSAGAAKINSLTRTVTLQVGVKDGAAYLGDIQLFISPEDRIYFEAGKLFELIRASLSEAATKDLEQRLRAAETDVSSLAAAGLGIRYDPKRIELILTIAPTLREARSLNIGNLDRAKVGSYVAPATLSAYLNIRGAFDIISDGPSRGVQAPIIALDGAARWNNVVLEAAGVAQPGNVTGSSFQRLGTRLVYDDQKSLIRWTAGDLLPLARGFQSAPQLAGISLFRSYTVLSPQDIIRPRGDRTFLIERPSQVRIQVNGQQVQQVQLAAGSYNLQDFPFVQGGNNVKISVIDDTGRAREIQFSLFLDQTQLRRGLSEFGFFAGVRSALGSVGPVYSDEFAVTGFYRRGISDRLTLGGNFQADSRVAMGGGEFVVATPLGSFGNTFSISYNKNGGIGYATLTTFQRIFQRPTGLSDAISLALETRSRNFSSIGVLISNNLIAWRISGSATHSFSRQVFGGFDFQYAKGRGQQTDEQIYRLSGGIRLSDSLSFSGDVRYESGQAGRQIAALLTLTLRTSQFSSARTDYDTRNNRARASYQALNGQGIGAYNILADVERSDLGSSASVSASYFTNRAELGFAHAANFAGTFSSSISQRSSFRLASSIAFADGAFSVGRPINDGFAIVEPTPGLSGTNIIVAPSPLGKIGQTGALGSAIEPNLSAYSERSIAIDAPEAKAGTDLGLGAFRVRPPYRAGYRLIVGSEYNVSVLGRLLQATGAPLALATGKAFEAKGGNREPLVIFTNREGTFGLAGLSPGKWTIQMSDDDQTVYELVIPEKSEGLVRVGDIRPLGDSK